MKAILMVVGKTNDKRLSDLTEEYAKRLRHYLPFEIEVIPDVKGIGSDPAVVREHEGTAILHRISETDRVILLDEKGLTLSSRQFAAFVQKRLSMGGKRIVFVVGGAVGLSESVKTRANDLLSLSAMTFTHQMVRLFFCEQLYRAMTILHGEAYHKD